MRHFFLLMLIFLVGCTSPIIVGNHRIESYLTLSAADVKAVVSNSVPDTVQFKMLTTDENYVIPTTNWIKNNYSTALYRFLNLHNVANYSVENNDCDDFAGYGRIVASILNANNPNAQGKAGIAIGEVMMITPKMDNHDMNFAVVAGPDKKPHIIFYEPQLQKMWDWGTNENWYVYEWRL